MAWRKGRKLHLVAEQEAHGRTGEIYADIREALGIPFVPELFQAYASYPGFLQLHWRALRPLTRRQEFYNLAARLRAEGYTRIHNYFAVPDLMAELQRLRFSSGALEELHQAVELFHYVDPLLLLVAAAQMRAFEASSRTPGAEPPLALASRPAVRPVYSHKPILLEEAAAAPPLRKIFDEVRRHLELPNTSSAFLAFARWPDFLRLYWDALRAVVQSPVFVESRSGIRETAWALAHEPHIALDMTDPQLEAAGIGADEYGALARLTEACMHSLSGQVLSLALAKIALEGGTASARVAAPEPAAGRTPDQVA